MEIWEKKSRPISKSGLITKLQGIEIYTRTGKLIAARLLGNEQEKMSQ